jgi:hypothetical protein
MGSRPSPLVWWMWVMWSQPRLHPLNLPVWRDFCPTIFLPPCLERVGSMAGKPAEAVSWCLTTHPHDLWAHLRYTVAKHSHMILIFLGSQLPESLERKLGPALGSAQQTDGKEQRWHSIRPWHLLGLSWLLWLSNALTQLILVVILVPAVSCQSPHPGVTSACRKPSRQGPNFWLPF